MVMISTLVCLVSIATEFPCKRVKRLENVNSWNQTFLSWNFLDNFLRACKYGVMCFLKAGMYTYLYRFTKLKHTLVKNVVILFTMEEEDLKKLKKLL